jgi:hypothetical protein
MAVTYEVGIRNGIVDAVINGYGATPKIRVYDGTVPANRAAALGSQVMLAQWTGSWAAASSGSRTFNGTADVTAEAFGAGTKTATFYRVYNAAGSVCMEQGTVTVTGGGGDAALDNVVMSQGQAARLSSFTKTAPGA